MSNEFTVTIINETKFGNPNFIFWYNHHKKGVIPERESPEGRTSNEMYLSYQVLSFRIKDLKFLGISE